MKEETLGKRLTKASIKRKISSKELAELIGVTPTSVGYYKSGKRNPSDATLKLMASILEVDFDWLKNGRKLINMSTKNVHEKQSSVSLTDDEIFEMNAVQDCIVIDEFIEMVKNLSIPDRVLINCYFDTFVQIDDSEWFLLNVNAQMNSNGRKRIANYINNMSIKVEYLSNDFKKIMLYTEIIESTQKENWFIKEVVFESTSDDEENVLQNKEMLRLIENIQSKIKKLDSENIEILKERIDSYVSMKNTDWRLLISYNLLKSEDSYFDNELKLNMTKEQGLVMDLLEDLVLIEKYRNQSSNLE